MSTAPQSVQIQGGTFTEAGHVYTNDKAMPVPSSTQILDLCGFVDYANVPGSTLEHKRQIGDSVHYATRLFDQDDLDPFSVHDEAAPYLECYMNLVDEVGLVPEPDWIEKSLVHTVHGMSYGMTVDRVCRFTKSAIKHRILLELKCAYAEEPAWKIQLASYELAVPKQPGEYIARVAAQLRPGKKARLFLYENPRDKDVFLSCLSIVNWRINEGMKWQKESL